MKFYTMDETGMRNTHMTNRLKQFSKEVFEFTKRYDSRNVNESNDALEKDFLACRLLVISHSEIEKYGAIDYIFGLNKIYLLQYANPEDAYCAYTKYLLNPDIIYVEPDKVIKLINSALYNQPKLALYEINTKHSWGYDYIKTEEAFNYILQNKNIDELPQIVVGIIDSGIDINNPVFKERLLASHSFVGDFSDTGNSIGGHGAKVLSILIENTLENVKFISYKIFSEHDTTLALLRLAEYQAELDGVDIINSSFGMLHPFESRIEKTLHIASAGNLKCNLPHYPAACKDVISVTGITEEGILTNTSTYGDWVCVAAPSENIRLPHTYGLEQYGDFNGTSCAAPFVTATCAMIKTQYPDLSNEQIKQVLFNSCTKADMPIQHGIVNMYNAVTYFEENIKQTEKLPVSSTKSKDLVEV